MDLLKPDVLISKINTKIVQEKNIQLDLLRLDLIHPEISGNKWFKLKHNIDFVIQNNYKSIVSFGGAYSNHLHALAFAGKQYNLKTIGIIRGEVVENETLNDCKKWGMEIHFMSRETYREKYDIHFLKTVQEEFKTSYIIPEGGNNALGQKGCTEILSPKQKENYDLFCCSIGTGATFTGIVNSLGGEKKAMGFSAIKNGHYIANEIQQQTPFSNFELQYEYHFGGFAKLNDSLITFMQQFKSEQQIELDRVYTGKMLFGIFDLIEKNSFQEGTKILAIHTGGLQGNRTLIG
jgi:1-aminocyclopropane-1-carboxylate deaminase/D-cysteine desulfhydrase-like pyridoxal-dependent ACC family enzyme